MSAHRALDVVRRIEASLAAGGFKVTRDSVGGRQAVIGRSARLRLGPRQHLFVLIAVFKAGMCGKDHLDRFLDEATQYAATVKGGLSSGATAIAVAVVEAGGPAGWAIEQPGRPQSGRGRGFPVLVDVAAGRMTCPDAPADLRHIATSHVAAGLSGG